MTTARFTGERGGLGRRPIEVVLVPGDSNGTEAEPRSREQDAPLRLSGKAGDAFVRSLGEFKKLRWSLTFAAFLAYIAMVTTYRIHMADVAVVAALIGLAFQGRIRFPFLIGLYAMFTAWCAFTYFQSPYPEVVLNQLSIVWKLGLILLAAVNAVQSRSQIRTFIVFWLGCFALYPVRGTYLNYFVAHYTRFGRALWNFIYANPNDLAALTLLQLSMVLAVLASERKGWVRWAALIGAPVLALMIFLTQSRGVIIALLVTGLVGAAMQIRRIRFRMVMLALATGAVVLMAAPAGVWNRLGGLKNVMSSETLGSADVEGSAEQRYEIWRTAGRIIGDNPVFGVGWGAYPQANAAYAPRENAGGFRLGARDTHSTYLNVAAELGIPGLALFLLLVVASFSHAERARRACARLLPSASLQLFFLELGLFGFLVAGLWGSYSRLSFLYLHMGLMYVVGEACMRDLKAYRASSARSAASG